MRRAVTPGKDAEANPRHGDGTRKITKMKGTLTGLSEGFNSFIRNHMVDQNHCILNSSRSVAIF